MVEFLGRAESTKTHPFVMAMGNAQQISQSFVIINGQALEQSTLLAAVDVCFKAFYIFDMNYPKQCASTWEFLQNVMFQMEGKEYSARPCLLKSNFYPVLGCQLGWPTHKFRCSELIRFCSLFSVVQYFQTL